MSFIGYKKKESIYLFKKRGWFGIIFYNKISFKLVLMYIYWFVCVLIKRNLKVV